MGRAASRAGRVLGRPPGPPGRIERLLAGERPVREVSLDPPLLSALVTTSRERRRRVPLAAIPPHVQQAVLAIGNRRSMRTGRAGRGVLPGAGAAGGTGHSARSTWPAKSPPRSTDSTPPGSGVNSPRPEARSRWV